jgi:hypothetical protein
MALRYEEADKDAVRLMEDVRAKHFASIARARIKLLYDLKRRKSVNGLTLGQIRKPNDLLRFFSRKDAAAVQGYDYVITIDKVAWGAISDTDRVRIIRHELRHTDYDIEAKDPYRLVKHDVNDFRAEIELNKDDPEWGTRVAALAVEIYAQQADNEKPPAANQGVIPGAEDAMSRPPKKSRKDAAAGE